MLRGAPSGLGQQDQYQLSMCILPASALPAMQVMVLRSLVLSAISASRPQCQLPLFIFPGTIASDAVMRRRFARVHPKRRQARVKGATYESP